MNTREQINAYIASLPASKRNDIALLHNRILEMLPACRLWFLDGKDDKGKIVTNPNIGYGSQSIKYANGKTREFYQAGISANTSGISVYIIGMEDKKYLSRTYGKEIGKAGITGYCIKFNKLSGINIRILETAIKDGYERTSGTGIS